MRLLRRRMKIWFKRAGSVLRPIFKTARRKQRLVVMDSETYREHVSFQLSGLNLFVGIGIGIIVLMVLTTLLIAFTPLKGIIPGYSNSEMIEQTYRNAVLLDSLENELSKQERMLMVMNSLLQGDQMPGEETFATMSDKASKVKGGPDVKVVEDSLLRKDFEEQSLAQMPGGEKESQTSMASQLYFPPLKGKVVSQYEVKSQHYGVDISGKLNEIIKSAGNGTVIFAGFTPQTGYVMAIQHPGSTISIYKHNSELLKKEGDIVKAGEPIAYLGNMGASKKGPHLHFELWINGKPVNPLQYVSF